MTTLQWIEPAKRGVLTPLLADHAPSMLISAVLEGHLGTALADDAAAPHVARLAYADVIFFGGDVRHPAARELVETVPLEKGILPSPGGWYDLLRAVHGERVVSSAMPFRRRRLIWNTCGRCGRLCRPATRCAA